MTLATNVCIFTSFGAIALYLLAYGTRAPWWRSAVGRSLFSLGIAIFAVSGLAGTAVLFGQDYELRPVARLLTWGATAFASVGLLISWWRAQRRGK